MEYLTVQEAAEKWGVSVRRVQALLKDGRISGAVRFGNHSWMIPADAEKPADARAGNGKYIRRKKEPPNKGGDIA